MSMLGRKMSKVRFSLFVTCYHFGSYFCEFQWRWKWYVNVEELEATTIACSSILCCLVKNLKSFTFPSLLENSSRQLFFYCLMAIIHVWSVVKIQYRGRHTRFYALATIDKTWKMIKKDFSLEYFFVWTKKPWKKFSKKIISGWVKNYYGKAILGI